MDLSTHASGSTRQRRDRARTGKTATRLIHILVFSYQMMNKLQNAKSMMVRFFSFLLLGGQVIAELERKTDESAGEELSGFET